MRTLHLRAVLALLYRTEPGILKLWNVLIGDQVFDAGKSRLNTLSGFGSLYDRLNKWRSANRIMAHRAVYSKLAPMLHILTAGAAARLLDPGTAHGAGLWSPAVVHHARQRSGGRGCRVCSRRHNCGVQGAQGSFRAPGYGGFWHFIVDQYRQRAPAPEAAYDLPGEAYVQGMTRPVTRILVICSFVRTGTVGGQRWQTAVSATQ